MREEPRWGGGGGGHCLIKGWYRTQNNIMSYIALQPPVVKLSIQGTDNTMVDRFSKLLHNKINVSYYILYVCDFTVLHSN